MASEIERKWLMNGFPRLKIIKEFIITQGYLSIDPELRVRKKENTINRYMNHKLTIKGNGDLKRIEVEKDISFEEYNQLKTMVPGDMIRKDYRVYDYNGFKLEISSVDFGSFYYAEIEFKSEEEANAFIAPDWFGEEITYDKSYKMKNYFTRKNEKKDLCDLEFDLTDVVFNETEYINAETYGSEIKEWSIERRKSDKEESEE